MGLLADLVSGFEAYDDPVIKTALFTGFRPFW